MTFMAALWTCGTPKAAPSHEEQVHAQTQKPHDPPNRRAPRDPLDAQMQLAFARAYELLGIDPNSASLTIEATPTAQWELDPGQWWKDGFLLQLAQEQRIAAKVYAAHDEHTIEEFAWMQRHRGALPPFLIELTHYDAHGSPVSLVSGELDAKRNVTKMERSEFFCETPDVNAEIVPSLTWPAIEAAVDRHYAEIYGWELTCRALVWPGEFDALRHSSIWWAQDLRVEELLNSMPRLPESVQSRIVQCWKTAESIPAMGPVTRLRMGLGIRPLAEQAGEHWAERARHLQIGRPRCLYPCEYLLGQRQTVIICQDELLWLRATADGAEVVAAQSFHEWNCAVRAK